ncbi:MAG: hypothetical protein ACYSO7_05390, partial [Planctomycetota bacterium]
MKITSLFKTLVLTTFFVLSLFFLAGCESHAGADEQNLKLGGGGSSDESAKNANVPQGQVDAVPYYMTRGKDIIDTQTGEAVVLKGFGIGGWLLPEGYMWGIRKLDRPRHFEVAIEELIGKEDAQKFWK